MRRNIHFWRRAPEKSSDLFSGVLFIFIGVFFAIYSYSYPLGSFARPGPGSFPFLVALLLFIVGLILTLKSLAVAGEAIQPLNFRSAGLVTLALVVGGACLTSLGVIVAVPAAVVISSFAAERTRLLPVLLMAAVLTAFTYLVFVVALGIQLPLYPGA